jgi:uncharacterized protein YbaP (TraB family)
MRKTLSILVLIAAVSFAKAQNNSLLWSIVKPGSTDTSYLFGSIHISDERVFNVNKHFGRVFDKSKTVALELHFDSINPFTLLNHVMMEKGLTLQKVMPEEKYAVVKSYFEDSLKSPMQFIERFQPIYTSTLIQTEGKSTPGKSLDETIFNRAKEQNKYVVGLEKAEEQMSAFSALPYKIQAEMLYQTVLDLMKNLGKDDSMEKLITMYANQDLEGITAYINNFDYEDNNIIAPYIEVLTEKLLIERNYRMLERSIPLLKNTTLIVVGAAHLPGNKGLIELFQSKGYDVKPLR